jgi:outer membrane protein OmpA-like peptidoglycan-associated protein
MNRFRLNSILLRSSIFVVLLFNFTLLKAQDEWDCPKPSKKAQKYFDKAKQYSFRGSQAYNFLISATNEDPQFAEAYSVLAYLNGKKDQMKPQNKNRTVSYYEKTHEACATFRNYEAAFWLAKHHYQERQYELSEKYLDQYISNANSKKGNDLKEARELKKQLEKYREIFNNPVRFDPKRVEGPSTKADEFLPMLSPDNQYLFYTRRAEVDSKSAFGKTEKELFIQSRKKYDGSYSTGIPMPTPFNKGSYQGGATISVDNRLLFITIVSQASTKDGRLFSNGDIYYSEFNGGKWGELKSIGNHINGRLSWEGQPSISANNKTLYFASARGEDNYGGMDLYKTDRQADGSWGPAVNLGPTINTAGNEKSPFMHSDSYTLYFSSDGHPGVGGQDVFFTKMNKFGKFDPPVNIGVPINTEEDEHGFMVSTDGRYGYFSSDSKQEGLDIYYFELPEEARPEDVVFLKGSISSKDPDAAKGMTIELKNMETNQVVEGVVDEENGEYVAVISARENQDVMMMAKKNGYAFTSQYINSDEDVVGKPMRAEPMEFKPIAEGETYQINNINFATDSYELNLQVMNILNEFIDFLKENQGVRVAIQGHTDNVGDAAKNLKLSEQRAKAVNNYLILEGIDPSRLEYEGFGESRPIASNDTEAGRKKNRRTEFVILSK